MRRSTRVVIQTWRIIFRGRPRSAPKLAAAVRRVARPGAAVARGALQRALALVERFDIDPYSEPNHQTLEGSFSAVSKPIVARNAAFFSIFRDLQDLQSFAPLRSPKFSKKLQKFCRFSNGSNGSIVRRSNLSTLLLGGHR